LRPALICSAFAPRTGPLPAWRLLAFGAVVVLTFEIAREYFGVVASSVAAAVIATSPVFVAAGASAEMDLSFTALVLVSLLLAMRARGKLAMGVLALAGLMRPEAWLLSPAYLAWLWWRDPAACRVLLVLAAAGPALWMLADVIVTGNPLYFVDVHRAQRGPWGEPRACANVPVTARSGFEHILTPPVLLGGVLGFIAALAARRALPVLAFGCLTGLFYITYGSRTYRCWTDTCCCPPSWLPSRSDTH
jgi:hypothetical protein